MPTTYTLINSNVLSSSAGSITFSSIPATYTDLVVRCSVRTDNSDYYDGFKIVLNSDTTTQYSYRSLRGTGSAAASNAASSAANALNQYFANGDTATANSFGSAEIYLPSYTSTANKPFSLFGVNETNATTAQLGAIAFLYRNATAISTFYLEPNAGGSFLTGSSFYLYGISNA